MIDVLHEVECRGRVGRRWRWSTRASLEGKKLFGVLMEVLSRYERGAAELHVEFEIEQITPELLMHVCLASPEVDDLIVGFIRDDLQVVSLSDQTRRMVERDIGFLAHDASRWMGPNCGSLGQQLSVRSRAEADARIAQGRSSELEEFILSNPEVHEKVRALKQSDLVRWVMLSLMRETNARKRGSTIIAAWRETLAPELRKRVVAIQARFGAKQKAGTQTAPASETRIPSAKFGP